MNKQKLIDVLILTIYISLIIQILTTIFNIGILSLDIFDKSFQDDIEILIQLVWLGLIVQIIEGTFYAWLTKYVNVISNITKYRYYDWFFSTPTMLITLVVYLLYLKDREENEKEVIKKDSNSEKNGKLEKTAKKSNNDLWSYIKENKYLLSIILFLNALMLLLGYLGEIGTISNSTAVMFGFIPFLSYFYLIYDNYAKHTTTGIYLFLLFTVIWSLYGFAALMPYYIKNIGYNLLDIVSKNFFEVFLGFKLLFALNI
uniref:Uncharacterized protein n=1 Tax=viral metagenome TaxID=1070528 RepID=A0A6C0FG99_9ZZZZ|tara:strand:+ start:10836 stop:11609 length:774 start_codon:yes stop_codon:yes gene_type:complete